MRVFLTGATGFIGTALVAELIGAGYEVVGMTRSDEGARRLEEAGAAVHRGTLEEPWSLFRGAEEADGVIHAAFDHDFSNFVANCEKDRRAIEALASALAGSKRPLVITSGVGMGSAGQGEVATEDMFHLAHPNPRTASEQAGAAALEHGVNVSVVRLPQVHDRMKQGLITPLIELSRAKGVAAYVGDGTSRWPAAHVLDVARVYRLALERQEAGSRYHAVAEEGIAMRPIVEVIGRGLQVPVVSLAPEEAGAHFGWLGMFAGLDMPASSLKTREQLGWAPRGPGLLEDLEAIEWAG